MPSVPLNTFPIFDTRDGQDFVDAVRRDFHHGDMEIDGGRAADRFRPDGPMAPLDLPRPTAIQQTSGFVNRPPRRTQQVLEDALAVLSLWLRASAWPPRGTLRSVSISFALTGDAGPPT